MGRQAGLAATHSKYFLVKIPVPAELIGGEIVAEVLADATDDG